MSRRNNNDQHPVQDWFKGNALALVVALCSMVGAYTVWQVNAESFRVATSQRIDSLAGDVKENSLNIKDNYRSIQTLNKHDDMNSERLDMVVKNEEKLQVSIEKLSDAVNALAQSMVQVQTKQERR